MTDAQITPEAVEQCCSYLDAEHRNRSAELTAAKMLRALAQQNAALKAQAAAIESETIERCARAAAEYRNGNPFPTVYEAISETIRALPRMTDPDALKRTVDAAVLAERQACAEIAENRAQAYEAQKALPLRNITLLDQKADTARIIAAAILARTETSHD